MDKNEMELNEVIDRLETCPNCKAVVNGDKFCHNCGKNLEDSNNNEVYCSKCGKKLEPNARFCNKCGNEVKAKLQLNNQQTNNEQGKVIIHSYEEFFIVNPDVKVYIDGNLITRLSKGETFEYSITKPTTIKFKSSIRSANVTVSPNAITEIRLMWNRATGSLETICNEQNFNGVNSYVNQQSYQGQVNAKKQSSNVWLVLSLILGLIALWLYYGNH